MYLKELDNNILIELTTFEIDLVKEILVNEFIKEIHKEKNMKNKISVLEGLKKTYKLKVKIKNIRRKMRKIHSRLIDIAGVLAILNDAGQAQNEYKLALKKWKEERSEKARTYLN